MSKLTLNKIGLPHMSIICPHCRELQTIKVRHTKPYMTRCHYCENRFVVKLETVKKPNQLNLRLATAPVPSAFK